MLSKNFDNINPFVMVTSQSLWMTMSQDSQKRMQMKEEDFERAKHDFHNEVVTKSTTKKFSELSSLSVLLNNDKVMIGVLMIEALAFVSLKALVFDLFLSRDIDAT